jgi:hypothetical protein
MLGHAAGAVVFPSRMCVDESAVGAVDLLARTAAAVRVLGLADVLAGVLDLCAKRVLVGLIFGHRGLPVASLKD